MVVDERTDSSRVANDDVITCNVRRAGDRITRIVNVYDQRHTHLSKRPARKLTWQRVIRQVRTGCAGDFNTNSTRWDLRCQGQRNAAFCEDVSDENGPEIGNHGEATYYWG